MVSSRRQAGPLIECSQYQHGGGEMGGAPQCGQYEDFHPTLQGDIIQPTGNCPTSAIGAERAIAALIPPAGPPAATGWHASTLRASLRSPEPGLILAVDQGERRVRRPPGLVPFTIKVDPLNGGSPDLVMGYEVLPPGQFIPPHRHPHADEILFIQYGRGVAELGGRRATVGPGGTVYIPRGARISFRVTGRDSVGLVFIFSHPGFEQYMRDTSVPEGRPAVPLSDTELKVIRAHHRDHVVYEQP